MGDGKTYQQMIPHSTEKLFILADQDWTEEELREKLDEEDVEMVIFIRSMHEEKGDTSASP